MPKRRIFLVTGASGEWGNRVAEQLNSLPGTHVIGLDKEKPEKEIQGLDFIQADLRNSQIGELLKSEKVDTVCHLAFLETRQPTEEAFDYNVMGTMKMLAACAQASVKKVVIMSAMAVYGARATNSAFLTEAHPLKANRAVGVLRDLMDIEAFCNGFRQQAPGLKLTVLRFPGVVGPTANTNLARYLKEPLVPVLLGFDPRMQIIHEDDLTGSVVYAALHDTPGVFNVAAEGILPLLKVIALAGKIPLPVFHLFAYWGVPFLDRTFSRVTDSIPYDLDSLRYDCVGDLTRMRTEFGYKPKYTAVETLREFAGYSGVSPFRSATDELKQEEERLRDTLERRGREKQCEREEQFGQDEQSEASIVSEGLKEELASFDQDAVPTEDQGEDEEIGGL